MAAELIALQNGPCALACIYDARCGIGNYSPLFNPFTYKPHKAYYAFTAFNELRRRGTAVRVEMLTNGNCHKCPQVNKANLHAAAAVASSAPLRVGGGPAGAGRSISDGSLAVMLANDGDAEAPFTLEVAGGMVSSDGRRGASAASVRCRITDETRTWAEVPLPAALPPHSVMLVEVC